MKTLQDLVDASMSAIECHQNALGDSLSMTQVREHVRVFIFIFSFPYSKTMFLPYDVFALGSTTTKKSFWLNGPNDWPRHKVSQPLLPLLDYAC